MLKDRLEQLLQGCRKGERRCQQEVYHHFYGIVYGVCLRYAASREEAKELANDAFFKAFTRLDQYEAGSNFGAWLYTIARRTALDRYRVLVQQPTIQGDTQLYLHADHTVESQLLDRMDAAEKLKLVHLLPPAYRTVFNLYVVEEYSHEEIAATLGISVGASKSNLFKARAKLRELVNKHQLPHHTYHGS